MAMTSVHREQSEHMSLVENIHGGFLGASCGFDQALGRHYDRKLRDQISSPLDALGCFCHDNNLDFNRRSLVWIERTRIRSIVFKTRCRRFESPRHRVCVFVRTVIIERSKFHHG